MEERLKDAKELLACQGQNGNWDNSEYMCGMYNGMELIIATIENRDPIYRTLKDKEE